MPDTASLVPTLVGFARRLRGAGVPLGTGDVLTYCAAVEPLDPTDLVDLYWAGRTALVTRHDQIPVYDAVFRAYFLDEADDLDEPVPFSVQAKEEARTELQLPESAAGGGARGPRGTARAGGLGRGGAEGQVVRRVHAGGAGRPAPHHAHRPADPAATAVPPDAVGARRAHPRPTPYRPGLDAHPRRPDRALVAQAPHPVAAPGADPRRVGLDDRLLPQPAPVRLLRPAGRHPGRGVLLRHPADPHHP